MSTLLTDTEYQEELLSVLNQQLLLLKLIAARLEAVLETGIEHSDVSDEVQDDN
jgi:hypothetical protein